jgi:hypothetical protein
LHILPGLLSRPSLRELVADALAAYDPRRNAIDLRGSRVVDGLRLQLEAVVGQPLAYYGAFFLLVSETTIETATGNAGDGWHVDSTCARIDGTCFNAWIPLYSRATSTGVEVIARDGNEELYERLGDPRRPLDIFARKRSADVFARLGVDDGIDLVVVRQGTNNALLLCQDDLVVHRYENPRPGDVALFRQTDIHRGFHDDGLRVQLSIKFVVAGARTDPAGEEPVPPGRPLTKHGRLEAQLVRELLGLQLERLD